MDTKVRLIHPGLIFLLLIIFLIPVMITLSLPQIVMAQDGITMTVTQTETLLAPSTVIFGGTITATITSTSTVTATPTTTTGTIAPTGTPTLKPTITPTGTITDKPTVTFTPLGTETLRPTVTHTTTATITTTAQTYIVSGTLGTKGAGAVVAYSGGSIIADSRGNYSFIVPHGWTGTITPFKTGYTFSPALIIVTTPVTADLPYQKFTTKQSHK